MYLVSRRLIPRFWSLGAGRWSHMAGVRRGATHFSISSTYQSETVKFVNVKTIIIFPSNFWHFTFEYRVIYLLKNAKYYNKFNRKATISLARRCRCALGCIKITFLHRNNRLPTISFRSEISTFNLIFHYNTQY